MAKYQKQRDSENQMSRWSRSNRRSFREKDSLDHVSSVPLSQGFLAARLRKKFSTEDNNRTIKFTTTPTTYVPHLGFDLQGLSGSYSHRCLSLRLACCRCLPNSRDHYINKEYYGAGLHDVLKVNASLVKGLWYWVCPVLGWTMQMTLPGPLVSPKDLTFSSPRVQEGIERSAELRVKGITFNSPIKLNSSSPVEHDVAVKEETERAKRILDIMCSSINVMLLRLTNYTMMWVLGKLFRHFYIQRSHIEMLKEAQTRDVPMVFLPCHKSHVDYILMTFALLNIGIKVPHIAAGDNLNIPIFNLLIHRLGGYFIRRKIDIGQTRDELYRDCLQEYIEQLLKANQNIEIYIEGSRSRSGKPSLAKSGLMSFLVDAVRDGTVSDVLIVPVGVSYDRIVERNFVRHELMGGNKRQENLFRALGGVWRMLSSNIGSVRVDFAQPFSLQEYLNSFHISSHSLLDFSHPSSSLLNNSTPNLSTPDRRIITALSQHIVYDFTNASSIMCTNIVGFLLLTKYRQGAKISHLIDSYRWVADRVTTSGRALGYSDSPSEAVHYALCYLKSLVYYKDFHVSNQTYKVVYPKLVTPDVFQLLHHSNQVNTLFIKESIIVCSLMAIQESLRFKDKVGASPLDLNEDDPIQSPSLISQDELLDVAVDITRIFAREFIFAPACVDLLTSLYDGIQSLMNIDILKPIQQSDSVRDHRVPRYLDWEEEEDERGGGEVLLEVMDTSRSKCHVDFFHCVLAPFIEGYWGVANELLTLYDSNHDIIGCHIKEKEFLQEVHNKLMKQHEEGIISHIESCSMDCLRNAFKSFQCMEILTIEPDNEFISITNHSLLLYTCDMLTVIKP